MLYLKFKNTIHSLLNGESREQGQGLVECVIILGLLVVVVAIVASIALSALEIEGVQDGINWLIENGGTN